MAKRIHLEVINTLNYMYRFLREGLSRGRVAQNGQQQTSIPFEFILYELNLIKSKLAEQNNLAAGLDNCLNDFATIDRLLHTYSMDVAAAFDKNELQSDRDLRNLARNLVSHIDLSRYSDVETRTALDTFLAELPATENTGSFFLHLGHYLLEEVNSRIVYREKSSNTSLVIKSLHFEPWSVQSGLSILGYIPILIDQICPDHQSRIILEKKGFQVFLLIDALERHHALIETTIRQYGQFLNGKIQAGDLLPVALHSLGLIHKIKLIELEFRYTNNLLFPDRGIREDREIDIENEFQTVNRFIRDELESGTSLGDILGLLTPAANMEARPAMEELRKKVKQGLTVADEMAVKRSLFAVKKYAPDTMQQLFGLMVNGGLSKTADHFFAKWLYSIHRAQVKKSPAA